MSTTECEKLAVRFKEMEGQRLCDVKFYLRNVDEAATEQVCRELNQMYEALDRGESQPLDFKDSYRAA